MLLVVYQTFRRLEMCVETLSEDAVVLLKVLNYGHRKQNGGVYLVDVLVYCRCLFIGGFDIKGLCPSKSIVVGKESL